jgi:hypothetical protein
MFLVCYTSMDFLSIHFKKANEAITDTFSSFVSLSANPPVKPPQIALKRMSLEHT